jgi:hypothetical protein
VFVLSFPKSKKSPIHQWRHSFTLQHKYTLLIRVDAPVGLIHHHICFFFSDLIICVDSCIQKADDDWLALFIETLLGKFVSSINPISKAFGSIPKLIPQTQHFNLFFSLFCMPFF